jgi:hypothetical protein
MIDLYNLIRISQRDLNWTRDHELPSKNGQYDGLM